MTTRLAQIDRFGSIAAGLGAAAYALFFADGALWMRGAMALLGLTFAVGGICGT